MRVLEAAPPFGLDNLTIADRPTPEPGPGEVLVRMRAVSLNYRDLLSVQGGYGRQVQAPVVPLSDGCGVIEKTGPGVTRVKAGDRVSTLFFQRWLSGVPTLPVRASALGTALEPGAARDFAVFNENGVSKVPDYLTDEQVATLACAGLTAWRALFEDARLQPGDVVVLQGTGGVSIYGLQFAKAAGYRTIITSSSDEKLERARKMGADHTINYKTTPEWGRAVREIVPRGADFIMEVGGGGTMEQSLRCIFVEGHIAIIGVLNNVAPPAALVGHMINTGAKLKGVFVGSRDMFEKMCAAMELHRIQPVVGEVYDFADARKAFESMRDGNHFGKIVLKM
jgi:NADPH:quinone reductase-like Zn-dependent oxidoreductase